MSTPINMLRNALIAVGWLIIFTSIIADILQFHDMRELLIAQDAWGYPEIRSTIASFITGIFQGIGLGLLCLFAAHKIKPFGDKP